MKYLSGLRKFLDQYYVKLPKFPKGLNDFIVNVAPWLALIFGILAVIGGISAFGALSFVSPFATIAGVRGYALVTVLSAIVLLLQGLIELFAFSPLKTRKVKGWNLMFYNLVLSVLSSIIVLSIASVINALIGALIGYYILYQVRAYYK